MPLGRPMHYTSGTTGRPKGVWSGRARRGRGAGAVRRRSRRVGLRGSDTHLVCSPMYHSVSVRFAAGTLLRGGSLLNLQPLRSPGVRPDPRRATAHHHLHGPHRPGPALAPPVRPHPFSTLCACWCTPGRRARSRSRSKPPPAWHRTALWEFYGATEGQFTLCSPEEWRARPGTVGRARLVLGEAWRLTPTAWCGAGLWCRAPVLPGFARFRYWGDDDATASVAHGGCHRGGHGDGSTRTAISSSKVAATTSSSRAA